MQARTVTSSKTRTATPAWKPILQALKDEHDRKAAPSFFAINGSLKGKWTDTDANGLTRCIIDYLTYLGGNFTRVNVMGTPRRGADGSLKFTPSTTKKGTADILGCFRGRYIAIEVKIGADRQSDDQKREQADVERAGGVYIVAKTFTGFLESFSELLGRSTESDK